MNDTIDYYEKNKDAFLARTLCADMTELHKRFLRYLPFGVFILDLGCGSGRDSRAFLDAGYRVEAIDGSSAMCDAAGSLLGQTPRILTFDKLDYIDAFDGIWACASLLHVPSSQIGHILQKVYTALKPGGYLYLSVKYGMHEGMRNGRYFTDYTQKTLTDELQRHNASIIEMWLSDDVRAEKTEPFLNAITRKI